MMMGKWKTRKSWRSKNRSSTMMPTIYLAQDLDLAKLAPQHRGSRRELPRRRNSPKKDIRSHPYRVAESQVQVGPRQGRLAEYKPHRKIVSSQKWYIAKIGLGCVAIYGSIVLLGVGGACTRLPHCWPYAVSGLVQVRSVANHWQFRSCN